MNENEDLLDIQNVCRICLNSFDKDINYDIFKVPDLAMKLVVCTSLKAEPQDRYPSRICSACFTKLNDLHAFQVMCQESFQRLEALLESTKYKNLGTSDNFVNVLESTVNNFVDVHPLKEAMQHITNDKDLNEFDPLLSPKVEEQEVECDFNMLETVDKITQIPQSLEETDASNEDDSDDDKPLAQRLRKNKLGVKSKNENCETSTEKLKCHGEGIACDKKSPNNRQLSWHLTRKRKCCKKLGKKSYPCTDCDKVFCSKFSLKKHMFKHDGNMLPYPCNICEKRFVTNSALKDHLMRHAGIKNYTCPQCGAGKTTRQEWNAHLAMHNNEKNFKCDQCSYATHVKQNLRMHVKLVHEKITDYACQYCGKIFGKSNACKMHEMTHTGEKRCECKICGKRFLYVKSLTKHLKTHEKRVLRAIEVYRKRQQDYNTDEINEVLENVGEQASLNVLRDANEILKLCAESAASIPKNPRLVERVEIEKLAGTIINPLPEVDVPSLSPQIDFMMKEGPHVCRDCGQGFNGSSNMRRHHRIVHQGVKNFSCRFCNQRFAKSQTLRHHEMRHTGEKPHVCADCGRGFIQRVALNRHMKVHNKSPELEEPVVSNDNTMTNPLE